MKRSVLLCAIVFAAFSVYGSLVIEIDLSDKGPIREDVKITLAGDYDKVQYTSRFRPISVSFDGDYVVEEQAGQYVLEFPNRNITSFSMLYDGMITRQGSARSYRSSFVSDEPVELSVTLPRHYSLAKEPSAIPKPDSVSTDGQRIRLGWKLDRGADVTVFYEGQRNRQWMWSLLVIPMLAAAVLFFVHKGKKKVRELISDDESLLLDAIPKEPRQDRIAKSLGFSKSKMSKVVRKLEEKNLIAKEVYFKTNKLRKK